MLVIFALAGAWLGLATSFVPVSAALAGSGPPAGRAMSVAGEPLGTSRLSAGTSWIHGPSDVRHDLGSDGDWTTMANGLNVSRYTLGSATGPCPGTTGLSTDKQCLYAIGGTNDKSVEYYDPTSGASGVWTTMTNGLNAQRQYVGAATGPCPGTTGLPTDKQCLYAMGGDVTGGSVEYYDPSSGMNGGWTTMTNRLNTGSDSLGSATGPCPGTSGLSTSNQCLYAIGGSNGGGDLNSVEYYDPASGVSGGWTTMTNGLNTRRMETGATTGPCPDTADLSSGKQCLYAIGGYDDYTIGALASVEYYDPSSGANGGWTTVTNGLTTVRSALGSAAGPCPGTTGQSSDRQCLYAIGGYNGENDAALASVEYYDPSSGTSGDWTAATSGLNAARAYLGAASGPCPGTTGLSTDKQCLYAVGGYNHANGGELGSVEYYDPSRPGPWFSVSAPATATVGQPFQVTVGARGGTDGSIMTGYTGTAHFTSSDPSASLPPDYTFTDSDQGSHTFDVTLQSGNADSLTVTDSSSPAMYGQTAVNLGPHSPVNVTAVDGFNAGTVDVSWAPPQFSGAQGAVTGYTVSCAPACTGASASPSESVATITGLTKGTSYTFTVVASNATQTSPPSASSNAAVPTSFPGPNPQVPGSPSAVVATRGNASASLTWTPPPQGTNGSGWGYRAVQSYTVTCTPSCGSQSVWGGSTSTTVTGLSNGTSYTFQVQAVNTVGSSSPSSPSNSVTPATVPDPPTGVNASPAGDGAVSLSWTAPANNGGDGITSYSVSCTPACPSASGLTTTGASTTVTGLTDGTAYTFTVAATNTVGSSTPSAASISVTPSPPAASLTVSDSASGGITPGTQVTVTVTAEDQNGGTATAYIGTVHFASSDLNAQLPSDYTFTPADLGVHTFSVTMWAPGQETVTASDGANGLTASTTPVAVGISISPGFNLIDVPLQGAATSAAALASSMNDPAQLGTGTIDQIDVADNGSWDSYVPGASPDLPLTSTEGVLVDDTQNQSGLWAPPGTPYTSAQTVQLQPGWDLVAAPYPYTGVTASEIQAEAPACDVQEVAVWSGGQYLTWVPGQGTDLQVPSDMGFWIMCQSAGSWTPGSSLAASQAEPHNPLTTSSLPNLKVDARAQGPEPERAYAIRRYGTGISTAERAYAIRRYRTGISTAERAYAIGRYRTGIPTVERAYAMPRHRRETRPPRGRMQFARTELGLVRREASMRSSASFSSGSHTDASRVVVSDVRPFSFTVSWASRKPEKGRVEIRQGGRWRPVSDISGSVRSRTHMFPVPCSVRVTSCTDLLKAHTTYLARIWGATKHRITLHVRTTPELTPFVPVATISGKVVAPSGRPAAGALVYATIRHKRQVSVPLVTLTTKKGAWTITLANAVTTGGAAFPLAKGDQVTIRALTGLLSGSTVVRLPSVDRPVHVKRPVVVH